MKVNSGHSSSPFKSAQLEKAVGRKSTDRVINRSVNSPSRARLERQASQEGNVLCQRKVEKQEIEPGKFQKQPGLHRYDFKIKSRNEVTSIEAIPLGSQGIVTTWNPQGLSAKELLKEKYNEGSKNAWSTVFGYFYTPCVPLSLDNAPLTRQVFQVKRGHDIAVSIANPNADGTISAGRFLPYAELATKLDKIVDRMVETRSYNNKQFARHRVCGDIIRVGSGAEIKGHYTKEEWHNLAEFAMVIRADKARAPKSTRYYIDDKIRDCSTSFKERFGSGAASLYVGAPKGGAKKLKERQVDYVNFADAERTDTCSKTPRQYEEQIEVESTVEDKLQLRDPCLLIKNKYKKSCDNLGLRNSKKVELEKEILDRFNIEIDEIEINIIEEKLEIVDKIENQKQKQYCLEKIEEHIMLDLDKLCTLEWRIASERLNALADYFSGLYVEDRSKITDHHRKKAHELYQRLFTEFFNELHWDAVAVMYANILKKLFEESPKMASFEHRLTYAEFFNKQEGFEEDALFWEARARECSAKEGILVC